LDLRFNILLGFEKTVLLGLEIMSCLDKENHVLLGQGE